MEAWKRQLIKSLFHYSPQRMDIERAFLVKHPHVPSYLYKYRAFLPHHKDALEQGLLYVSSPNRFNDPYDSAVVFDPDRFLVEDEPVQKVLEKVEDLKVRGEVALREHMEKPVQHPITVRDLRQKHARELLKEVPHAEEITSILEQISAERNLHGAQQMTERFREGYGVLSLSEVPDDILMWSHYSNNHKGFCIEYAFRDLGYNDLRRRLCFPVFYRSKMTDATRWMRHQGTSFNNLFGQYICLIKNTTWSYEKEWRIVEAIGPDHANREMMMPKPSALIAGAEVEPADYEYLKEFCQSRSIEIKKVTRDPRNYRLQIVSA